jgi:hypothetical protein
MSIERLKNDLVGVTVATIGPSSLSPDLTTFDRTIMPNPTDQAEPSIPMDVNPDRSTVPWKEHGTLSQLVA